MRANKIKIKIIRKKTNSKKKGEKTLKHNKKTVWKDLEFC